MIWYYLGLYSNFTTGKYIRNAYLYFTNSDPFPIVLKWVWSDNHSDNWLPLKFAGIMNESSPPLCILKTSPITFAVLSDYNQWWINPNVPFAINPFLKTKKVLPSPKKDVMGSTKLWSKRCWHIYHTRTACSQNVPKSALSPKIHRILQTQKRMWWWKSARSSIKACRFSIWV